MRVPLRSAEEGRIVLSEPFGLIIPTSSVVQVTPPTAWGSSRDSDWVRIVYLVLEDTLGHLPLDEVVEVFDAEEAT